MRVLVLSHPETDGSVRRGFPEKQRSMFWPLFWWRRLFSERGFFLSVMDFQEGHRNQGFDVVAVSSRALNVLPGDERFQILSRLREGNGRLVYLDQSDGTGLPDFAALEWVDTYAKRHLLRDPALYGEARWHRGIHYAYYRELLGLSSPAPPKSTPLGDLDFTKIRLSWGFHHSVYPQPHKVGRLLNQQWPRAPRIPRPRFADIPDAMSRTHSTGAFFFGKDSGPVGQARNLARETIAAAGGLVLAGQVRRRDFHRVLALANIAVSPFGYGEMCFRDFEIAMTGRILAKPSVEHLVTFPHILKKTENYLSLGWDPRKWVEEIRGAHIARDSSMALHNAYREEFSASGANRFVNHLVTCVFGEKVCAHCAPLLSGYQPPNAGVRDDN